VPSPMLSDSVGWLPPEPVIVSLFPFADWHPVQDSLGACLSPEELDKLATLRFPQDRVRQRLSFGLTRQVLADRLGCAPEEVPLRRSDRGRPWVPGADCDFNVSHSAALLAIALGPAGIGIDVEPAEPLDDAMSIAPLFLHDADLDQLRCMPAKRRDQRIRRLWTECEAFLKGTGRGIDDDLNRIKRHTVSPRLTLMRHGSASDIWRVHYLGVQRGHHLSIATPHRGTGTAYSLPRIRIERPSHRCARAAMAIQIGI